MTNVINMSGLEPLRFQRIKKMDQVGLALGLEFNRALSDEEISLIEEFLEMMVNQSGVLNFPKKASHCDM